MTFYKKIKLDKNKKLIYNAVIRKKRGLIDMYLCEKKDDIVNVYMLNKKQKELKRYKQILLLTKKEKLFYKLFSDDSLKLSNLCRGNDISISNDDILTDDFIGKTYPYTEKLLAHEAIISMYADDKLENAKVASIKNGKEEKDYVITTGIQIDNNTDKFSVENMLNLPQELTAIQLIESSNWSKLYDKVNKNNLNIDDQLKLFKLEYIDSIDFKKIEMLYNAGIIYEQDFRTAQRRINEQSKVLQMIKH